eukprot:TRINITY_DN13163_c0_g1_i1.p1 TRINITY_DN13163_c0_g1~~TRINITY_DN13163_c0_g1_i1.p1  ORF type:complete len:477 (+),score=27.44 TRINITY_DN13163_c0_g1_i1:79-1431(+)
MDKELMASGECFLVSESQQLGGLIANAVHDTMQRAFTPETILHIRAAVFHQEKAIIRDFSREDGDQFFSFFGGFGITGIIVAATVIITPKTYFHRLVYSPGTSFVDDYQRRCPPPALRPFSDCNNNYAITNFKEAMMDLVRKHKHKPDREISDFSEYCRQPTKGLLDVAACFVLFSNSDTPVVVSRTLSRYFRYTEDKPESFAVIKQDHHNDYSALLAKEYCNSPESIDILSHHAIGVEAAIQNLKYKAVNIQNFRKVGHPHEAYYQSNVAHTTGPHYIYLWDKAVEYYVRTFDIPSFCDILEIELRNHLLPTVNPQGTFQDRPKETPQDASTRLVSIFADCRYVCHSDTAFMTGFYGQDAVAIDIGCTKFHYSNDVYTKFTSAVLRKCIEADIHVRLHTGKFYVYEKELVDSMYEKNIRDRLAKVVRQHDPTRVFAPKWMRELFDDVLA